MTAAVSSNIAAVLSDIQWDEGFSIPVANASNKALEGEIQQKQKEVKGKMNHRRMKLDLFPFDGIDDIVRTVITSNRDRPNSNRRRPFL